jgi:hypothetical protein
MRFRDLLQVATLLFALDTMLFSAFYFTYKYGQLGLIGRLFPENIASKLYKMIEGLLGIAPYVITLILIPLVTLGFLAVVGIIIYKALKTAKREKGND